MVDHARARFKDLFDVKDDSIIEALAKLNVRFGEAIEVADHWDADRMSIGVIAAGRPERLVYFSTWQRPAGHYYVDVEFPPPPGSEDLVMVQGPRFDDVEFEALVAIVVQHLGVHGVSP